MPCDQPECDQLAAVARIMREPSRSFSRYTREVVVVRLFVRLQMNLQLNLCHFEEWLVRANDEYEGWPAIFKI